jgi:anti-anti-sigma factor
MSSRAEAATNMNEETNNKNSVMICRHTDKAVVASFKEKLIYDVATVEAVETTMRSLLAKKPGNMVINFADVDFMVTRVINILLMALKQVGTAGGEVYLAGMNDNIRRVFDIMRLNVVFKIFDTEEQALAELEKPS